MVKAVTARTAKEYEDTNGKSPFKEWIHGLKDVRAKAKLTKAITQMEAGNFGDHKSITDGKGLYERRLDYGPGYRIYYIKDGDKLIIIFAGSDKSDQQKAIDDSKGYYADYLNRKKTEPVEEVKPQAKGKSHPKGKKRK
ncbi:type II toxin-antitoxin system RelE/ParE family toxin [Vibrio sp. 10N.237.312.C02]|jgi:putative addiction module killer protein|uniref:type II toxin-antitoxin system RelE/ParE family toxin n=1 Tax=Vibrio sp. 10N.237.312.C02 TaxID=3229973 RepID=UPI0035539251